MMPFLQIIVPAFNEEKRIYENLLRIHHELSSWCNDFKIIVVNDGSTDHTLEQCDRARQQLDSLIVVSYDTNLGKGAALKAGTAVAKPIGYIGFIDADLDISPNQIKNLYDIIEETGCDAVIGSKLHKESEVDYPVFRRVISYCYYLIIRLLFGLSVHDTQTGLKLFRAELIKSVMEVILVKKYAYDIEILSIMSHRKALIKEAGVKIVFSRPSPFGRIKLRDIWTMAVDTMAVFYRLRITGYYDRQMELL